MMASPEYALRSNCEPTVFVIDDDESVRESLEGLIREAGWKAETFSSAQAFFSRRQMNAPSCLLLDMALPGASGLDVQKSLAAAYPHIPIIFITGYADVPMTVQAMKAGAFEFPTKPFDAAVVVNAVRRAIDCSHAGLRKAVEPREIQISYASLTPRECDVLALVVSGLMNKQIAAELGISVVTVKVHRGRLMRKMSADCLADLVRLAAKLL